MIIAIDGPAGSGKSTIAKIIANQLGFHYLDTGAMYRAITYRVIELGEDINDADACEKVALNEHISFAPGEPQHVFIADEEVTSAIRTAAIDAAVSPVSAHPPVRAALVEQQRRIGAEADIVLEGRDIGTVVFPNAEVKIFLSASPETRAHRRALQNAERGIGETDEAKLLEAIIARDEYDSTREVSPLRPAEDAVRIDTSDLTIEEVVDQIISIARSKMN